jgi:hypothetical protein
MSDFIVSYDLHQQRHYPPVWNLLEAMGAVRLLESLWVVSTNLTAMQIRDALQQVIDNDDSTAVIELKPGSWWANRLAKPQGVQWLQRKIMA